MKLKATNPLVLFVGALAIGLAGCADDVIITEPPPPPPPPPPEAAEISIVSVTEFDDGAERFVASFYGFWEARAMLAAQPRPEVWNDRLIDTRTTEDIMGTYLG